jgi:hypothetical protein
MRDRRAPDSFWNSAAGGVSDPLNSDNQSSSFTHLISQIFFAKQPIGVFRGFHLLFAGVSCKTIEIMTGVVIK